MKKTLVTLSLLAGQALTQATVINSADVNGFRTFTDTTTGYIWADLDNWLSANTGPGGSATVLYSTYAGYLAALQSAGFTWADSTTVDNMISGISLLTSWVPTLNAMNTDWGSNLESIGGYSDLGGGSFYVQESRSYPAGMGWADYSPTSGNPTALDGSRGLWAYRTSAPGGPGAGGSSVPEPGTLALAAIALAATAWRRKARG